MRFNDHGGCVKSLTYIQIISYKLLPLHSRVNNHRKAVVLVEAKIEMAGKETTQKEIYYLIQEGEKWFIDDLVVNDGEIELEKIADLRVEK